MIGIIGIIASLTVLGLSLVITRIATTALSLTGLSWEAAKFQARSAFTGTGFTTSEAEKVVDHPVRRQVIMWLMVARSAGMVSILISLILSFGTSGENDVTRLVRLGWLVAGVGGLWTLARSDAVEQWMRRIIEKALNRWTDLEVRDYTELLKLTGEYSVREVKIDRNHWLSGKQLEECRLHDEGVLILGIYRGNGTYVGAPVADTQIFPDDTLVLYGKAKTLQNLGKRRTGRQGETEHKAAVSEQKREAVKQVEKEQQDWTKPI